MNQREAMMKQFRDSFTSSGYPVICETVKKETLFLPCEDGVELFTEIFTPDPKEIAPPYSTVVQRSCYPHMQEMLCITGEEMAKRGFAFVYQFCRGTGPSKGVWEPNVNDRADGLCLMRYLDGLDIIKNIGYRGASYLAFTGWVMADAVPKKVKSLYLTVYGTDRHTSAYQDGLFRQDILTAWAMDNAGFPISADYMESAKYRPQIEVDEALWGRKLPWYRDWISNTDRTSPYWNQGFWKMLREIPSKMKIPVFVGEGWYDHHLGSALKGFSSLSKESAAHAVLNVGPWNHSSKSVIEKQKALGLALHSEENETKSVLDWFTLTLKEEKLPERKVRFYLIGADTFLEFPDYPVPFDEEKALYLGENETLLDAPGAKGQQSYRYDPNDPVPSYGAESLFRTMSAVGSLRQPDVHYRSDVLSFRSLPFEEDTDIIGPIKASLYVSSDAPDTAFTFKIMEEFPDGEAYHIRSGITTLAYRNGSPERISYTPNTVEQITVQSWDVAWRIQKGSRIRVDISSSNFPEYAVHPNKEGVWSTIKETAVANQTIYFGPDTPSAILLPTVHLKKE